MDQVSALQLADIPSAGIRPARYERSVSRRDLVRNGLGRRSFLRISFVLGSAFALTSFESLVTRSRAFAEPETWNNCTAWDPYKTNGWWVECNPLANDYYGGQIDSQNIGNHLCNDNGYHRQDTTYGPGSIKRNHHQRLSCGTKNAWEWRITDSESWQNKRSRRCSDGWFKVTNTDTGNEITRSNSVCMKMFPGSDPNPGGLPFNQYTPDGCKPGADRPADC